MSNIGNKFYETKNKFKIEFYQALRGTLKEYIKRWGRKFFNLQLSLTYSQSTRHIIRKEFSINFLA
jgi:hypothetical protein